MREILCQSVSSEAAGVLASPDGRGRRRGEAEEDGRGSKRGKEDKRGPNEEWRIRKRKKGERVTEEPRIEDNGNQMRKRGQRKEDEEKKGRGINKTTKDRG